MNGVNIGVLWNDLLGDFNTCLYNEHSAQSSKFGFYHLNLPNMLAGAISHLHNKPS